MPWSAPATSGAGTTRQRLDQAYAVMRRSATGAWLDQYLRASGAIVVALDEYQWAARGYPVGVVAASTGSSIALRASLLDDSVLAALTIAHEATHVVDVREGLFQYASGADPATASRHGAAVFERLGIPGAEGAAWGWHATRVPWEIASEAHAYRNQAVVARELGMFDGGSAVGRGMDSTGRVFAVSEAVAALAIDPLYGGFYSLPTTSPGAWNDAGSAIGGGPTATAVTFLGVAGWHRT